MTSLGSANWRVHPMQEMEPSGASAAISTSSYGGIHMPGIMNRASKSKTETSSSMETAYWSGRRKQLGLSRLDVEKESETTENEKYDQFLKDMSVYVERNFHQKECIKFIPKPNQKVTSNQQLKCHCGEILSLHVWARSMKEPGGLEKHVPEEFLELARNPTAPPPQVIPQVEWKAECDISPKSSWTYGKVNFNVETSGGKKPAKYLRLSNEDSVDSCLEFMETFWHIMDPYPPNLVISVVGGAKNFKLDGEMRDTFSNGLIKAAKTTNAWLITSGFNMGVMKSVGQAVHEGQAFLWDNDRMRHVLRCIAIAPWGYVYNRRFLEARNRRGRMTNFAYYRTSNRILHGQPVALNPDHTHFLFIDDGMRNRYGGVADFRARFERKLCTPKQENGYGIPVVMMVVEGGPDAIQDACQSLKEGIPVVVCTGTGRAADLLTYAHKFTFKDRNGEHTMNERQRKTLEDRVATAYSKNWGDKAEAELKKVMIKIFECMKRDNLMVFFDLRREEDLDVAILSVLTKAETSSGAKNRLSQLELALTWNRADIAQSEIFREDVNWEEGELNGIMTKALLEDKMSFVRLLLNQGVSMKDYLTVPRLEHLYNVLPQHGFLPMIFKRHIKKTEFTVQDISKFLTNLLDRYEDNMLNAPRGRDGGKNRTLTTRRHKLMETTDTEAEEEPQQFQTPYKQLMIWAVLLDRKELAKFFWEMGEEPITSALSASMLCLRMHRMTPKYLHTIRQDFLNMKKMFEELATKVLDECHARDPEKAIMLVERKSPMWSRMSCLQIAAAANDQLFVASVACQNSVNNVWKSGILSDWRQVFLCALMPFLILPVINVVDMGSKYFGKREKILTFVTAPITKFTYHMLSYILFLCGYTYMLLVDFMQYPSPLEIVLMLWILSFFIGEIHTFIAFPSPTIRGKIRDWFTFLNRLELANLLVAFIGFAMRTNSDYYTTAKTVYCINAVIFFIRIIKVYIANSHLGPKLYMIIRMVEELMMFMVVLVVFLLAYGVCSQGLMYKRREPSFEIVKDIIQFPYWQLYGEIFLEEIQTDTDCIARLANGTTLLPYENTCRESYWLVYIMLGLYLLVGNVLLLNLLIAIFSHVFNQVEENSVEIWKYQMYFLVMEFQCKSKIPPPVSIVQHLYELIRFFAKRYCCGKKKHTQSFSTHHLNYLALFEKEMMANYLRRLKFKSMDSMDRRFTKLQKRIDMLNKIIEDRHVEDELAMQASLRLGDGLKVLSATVNRPSSLPESASTPVLAASKPPRPAAPPMGLKESAPPMGLRDTIVSQLKEDSTYGPEQRVDEGATKQEKVERETKVAFNLFTLHEEEEGEMKKKRHKKKKKKEKHSKTEERDSSPEKKVLNINLPEIHTKPTLDKQISDENNEESTRAMHRPRSQSPADSTVFFKRPTQLGMAVTALTKPSPESLHGDEPDLESEVEETTEAHRSPRVPRRQSRGKLNMLSHSENRMLEDEEQSDSSSADSYTLHAFRPPHNRGRKNHKRKSPARRRSDSD